MEAIKSPCLARHRRGLSLLLAVSLVLGQRLRADPPARSAPCHEESRRARQLELVLCAPARRGRRMGGGAPTGIRSSMRSSRRRCAIPLTSKLPRHACRPRQLQFRARAPRASPR